MDGSRLTAMLGALIVVFVVVVVLPVSIIMSGGVVAAILGWSSTATSERDHAGSELVELN